MDGMLMLMFYFCFVPSGGLMFRLTLQR